MADSTIATKDIENWIRNVRKQSSKGGWRKSMTIAAIGLSRFIGMIAVLKEKNMQMDDN